MASLSNRARRQANLLLAHYLAKEREEAASRLAQAVEDALHMADSTALRAQRFPSVYHQLAPLGFRWFKVHRYWFAIEATQLGNVIAHIIHEQANIPSRVHDPDGIG